MPRQPPSKADGGFGANDREPRATPIDVHVGGRIRLRRTLLGMSQERLGEALGLTFQQVQKYERGVNRVSASRLFDLARVLDVPIGFFYDDLPTIVDAPLTEHRASGFAEEQEAFGAAGEQLNQRETLELIRAYYRITDVAVRKRVFELVKSMASDSH